MKTIAIHSHKGGVGKTTIALLLAKYWAMTRKKVCVIDFDFLGSGINNLFKIEELPDFYLEHLFLSHDSYSFDPGTLLGRYTDDDLDSKGFSLILHLDQGLPASEKESDPTQSRNDKTEDLDTAASKKRDEFIQLRNDMMGLIANESHYRQIQTGTQILFDYLAKQGFEIVIVDCHPGLGFVSETAREASDYDIYVTTPNRSDCFGLIKLVNLRKELDQPTAFLLLNLADPALLDGLRMFKTSLEEDALVGVEAQSLLGFLKHVGADENLFAAIPRSELFRKPFNIGMVPFLPRIDSRSEEFDFCAKITSFINNKQG